MVETCDAQMFLSIPAMCILYDMESVIQRFAPTLVSKVAEIAKEVRKVGQTGFNKLEMDIIEI